MLGRQATSLRSLVKSQSRVLKQVQDVGLRAFSTKTSYSMGLIPGDGIGRDIIPEGVRVVEALGDKFGFDVKFKDYPWSCDYYLEHGHMQPESAYEEYMEHDVLLLGAVGDPARVLDSVSLRGLLIPIRQRFDLYLNLRPGFPIPGIPTPLAGDPQFDMLVIRENSEGEYSGAGGRLKAGTQDEVAIQSTIFTRKGVERSVRYAFECAQKRSKLLASATKSNAMQYAFVMWDEVVDEVAKDYPDVKVERYHCDALAAKFITHPMEIDVVVGSNLLTDILTDLLGGMQGSMGIPASANIDPTRTYPSLFEPVHGSAPDIVGRNIANPIATIWCIQMMMDHMGQEAAGQLAMDAVKAVSGGIDVPQRLTVDVGGTASTSDVVDAVLSYIKESEVQTMKQ